MDAPRPASLFRHAHWMLLGLVLALGVSFWIGSAKFGKQVEDTYLDPHRLAALKTFEPAIEFAVPGKVYPPPAPEALRAAFPQASTASLDALAQDLQSLAAQLKAMSPPGKPLRFDLARWRPAGPAPREAEEAISAAHWLAQGQRLAKLDWPGLRRAKAGPPMQVPAAVFQQDNPWRGADGCVYLRPATGGGWLYLDERRGSKDLCPAMLPPGAAPGAIRGISRQPGEKAPDDPAWAIPDDLNLLLSGLTRIRSPAGTAYEEYTRQADAEAAADSVQTHGPNRLRVRGRERDVGFNVYLTLNPATQALAQRWARCYTGERSTCDGLGLDAKDPLRTMAAEMYETAAMRMAAVAVIDVASGKIEALGSAHTPCYRQDHSGTVHGGECPDAPFRPRYDNDRLYNHALYVDAMPASTVKPILALAFLQDNPAYRAGPALQALWHDLKTSNSEAFLDRLFCGDAASRPPLWQWQECQRPQKAQAAAAALGWNLGCEAQGAADCARLDVLFGRPSGRWPVEGTRPMGLEVLYGRLFTEPPAPEKTAAAAPADDWARTDADNDADGFRLVQTFRFDESFAKACSRGDFCPECDAQHKRWRRCRGVGGKLANEGWGQGEARVIPLAVAGMLSRLAAAANGASAQAFPHLVEQVGDVHGKPLALAAQRYAGPEPLAVDPALAGLVLQGMSSHQSGGTAHSACKNAFGSSAVCDHIDWLAGKTGTPPFRFDDDTLSAIRTQCYAADGKPKIECNLMPYKWYVAAFKTGTEPGAPYSKAIAVLSERNWRKKNGLVQAPGDRDVNLSAELALRIVKALHPPVPAPSAPPKPKAKP